jgi:hypothetical protein
VVCDWAQYVADVTIPDGTRLPAETGFTKTWRLRNLGSCTWTTRYTVVFVTGSRMSAPLSVGLPHNVAPGGYVDVSVPFVSPGAPGSYRGDWMLRNASGSYFGIGDAAVKPFWVSIRVGALKPNPNYIYDFAAKFCSADWVTRAGDIQCGGTGSEAGGSVVFLTDPDLESRQENEPALWVRPNLSKDGWIRGIYPAFTLKAGDHFVAGIGCMQGSKSCDVTFQLLTTTGGVTRSLGSWREIHDGKMKVLDIDLSSYAGRSVEFALYVYNNGAVAAANAFWFVPHIERQAVPPTPTSTRLPTAPPPPTALPTAPPLPTALPVPPSPVPAGLVYKWRLTGGVRKDCSEVWVSLIGSAPVTAVGEAFDCRVNPMNSYGKLNLSGTQVNMASGWLTLFKPYHAPLNQPQPGGSLYMLDFYGRGISDPPGPALQDMQNIAIWILGQLKK